MGASACTRCGECQSDLAEAPSLHCAPEPHRFVTKYDQNTGKPYLLCSRCTRRAAELAADGEIDPALTGCSCSFCEKPAVRATSMGIRMCEDHYEPPEASPVSRPAPKEGA